MIATRWVLRVVSMMVPLTEAREVAAELDATAETARFLGDNQIALQASPEFDEILAALAVDGRPLDPLQLLSLAAFLGSVDATAAAVRRARASFPILRRVADTVASSRKNVREIRRKIYPAGEVADDTSPELRAFATGCASRRRAAGDAGVLPARPDTAKFLQQQVGPTATAALSVSCRASIGDPGIVHAARAAAPALPSP